MAADLDLPVDGGRLPDRPRARRPRHVEPQRLPVARASAPRRRCCTGRCGPAPALVEQGERDRRGRARPAWREVVAAEPLARARLRRGRRPRHPRAARRRSTPGRSVRLLVAAAFGSDPPPGQPRGVSSPERRGSFPYGDPSRRQALRGARRAPSHDEVEDPPCHGSPTPTSTTSGRSPSTPRLMELADIREWEQVQVVDIDNGARFETYAIPGGPGDVCLNGAAARLVQPGDRIIVITYARLRRGRARGLRAAGRARRRRPTGRSTRPPPPSWPPSRSASGPDPLAAVPDPRPSGSVGRARGQTARRDRAHPAERRRPAGRRLGRGRAHRRGAGRRAPRPARSRSSPRPARLGHHPVGPGRHRRRARPGRRQHRPPPRRHPRRRRRALRRRRRAGAGRTRAPARSATSSASAPSSTATTRAGSTWPARAATAAPGWCTPAASPPASRSSARWSTPSTPPRPRVDEGAFVLDLLVEGGRCVGVRRRRARRHHRRGAGPAHAAGQRRCRPALRRHHQPDGGHRRRRRHGPAGRRAPSPTSSSCSSTRRRWPSTAIPARC